MAIEPCMGELRVRAEQWPTHIEVALTIGAAYLAYALAEALALSGVLSLFFCGVLLGHYNWYNLSNAAKVATGIVFKSIAYLCETLVFAYLGALSTRAEFAPRLIQRLNCAPIGIQHRADSQERPTRRPLDV